MRSGLRELLILTGITVIASFIAFGQSNITSQEVFGYAGLASNGTSEIDTLTIQSGTDGGTFSIAVANGRTSADIAWTATDATLIADIDAALEALSTIGEDGVTTAAGTLSSGIGTVTITFTGKNARRDMPALSIGDNSLTGGSAPTLTTTTAGVEATFRDAPKGTLLVGEATPKLWINDSSTPHAPTWTQIYPTPTASATATATATATP